MLQMPAVLMVEIQPIGRGATSALKGSCLRPCWLATGSSDTPVLLACKSNGGIPPTPHPSPHHAEGVSSTRRVGRYSSARPAGHDVGELRPLALGLPLLGRADVDEAGHALVGAKAQRGAHRGAV